MFNECYVQCRLQQVLNDSDEYLIRFIWGKALIIVYLTENLTVLLHPCVNFTSHAEGNEHSNEKLYF